MNTDDKTDRKTLKSYFKKNSRPTENNFAELIDGMINQKDDGLVKLRDKPLSIEAVGNESTVIDFYQNFDGTNPDWILNLNSRSDKDDSNSAKLGFHIRDGDGKSRLFIDRNTGNVGIGKIDPEVKLEVSGAIKASGITISDGGIRQLFIADNGKVGIGTINHKAELEVHGDTQINGRLCIDSLILEHSNNKFFLSVLKPESRQTDSCLQIIHRREISIDDTTKGIYLRENGNVGIGASHPEAELEVNGLIKAGGLHVDSNRAEHLKDDGTFYRYNNAVYITVANDLYIRGTNNDIGAHFETFNGKLRIGPNAGLYALGGTENMTIIRGTVPANGHPGINSGFVVYREGNGQYEITFNTEFSSTPTVIVTQQYPDNDDESNGEFKNWAGRTTGNAVVAAVSKSKCRIQTGGANGERTDRRFHFIAIGPR